MDTTKDSYDFVANTTRYFQDLAYLHKYYPPSIDPTGHPTSIRKEIGHGRFDKAVNGWIKRIIDVIMTQFYESGKISDGKSIEDLNAKINLLKLDVQSHEFEEDLIHKYCIMESQQHCDCLHCPYALSCMGNFTQKLSFYEYFVKSFDFKKTFLNSLYMARNALYLEEVTENTETKQN